MRSTNEKAGCRGFRGHHAIWLIVMTVLFAFMTSCGTGKTAVTDVLSDVTESDEETESASKENSKAFDEQDGSETENDIEEVWHETKPAISDSDFPIKENILTGTKNIYRLALDGIDGAVIGLSEYGSSVLILYADEEGTGMLAVNPLTLQIDGNTALPEGSYGVSGIAYDETGNILVINQDRGELYFFDKHLQQYDTICISDEGISSFAIAEDCSKLYYVDGVTNEIKCMELGSAGRTVLCDDFYGMESYVCIDALMEEENSLIISVYDGDGEKNTELYHIDTGKHSPMGNIAFEQIETYGETYVAQVSVDHFLETVYGKTGTVEYDAGLTDDRTIFPGGTAQVIGLEQAEEYENVKTDIENGVFMTYYYSKDSDTKMAGIEISLYNMEKGIKTCGTRYPLSAEEDDVCFLSDMVCMKEPGIVVGAVCVNDENNLFVWDLNDKSSRATDAFAELYKLQDLYEADAKTLQGLKNKADEIGRRRGVEIYIGEEIQSCTKNIYTYTVNQNAVRISKALDELDRELGRYPNGMLAQIDDDFGSMLKIYLCGPILPDNDTAISTAVGLQNTMENDTYLVLDITAVLSFTTTIHHELFHAIEKHLDATDTFFDSDEWNNCNPPGFQYDYDYIANESSHNTEYVVGDVENSLQISFIDRYSKSFPVEDRARIMEYAMMEDRLCTGYFEHTYIRKKLELISRKLREGFDTTGWPEVTAWEKVLQ